MLSLEKFASLNAAGRRLSSNRFTGENRMRRAVTNTALADQLQRLLIAEGLRVSVQLSRHHPALTAHTYCCILYRVWAR